LEACQLITSAQIRAARSAIDMTAGELSNAVGVSRQTMVKIEGGHGVPSVNVQTLIAIKKIFEAQGIEFITAPDGSPGIVIRSNR
jgi:DNA-binding XRE family transcriptional regulator